jgi:murein DD-endopeptidase MepM/ murein hydrolase activator NlpD
VISSALGLAGGLAALRLLGAGPVFGQSAGIEPVRAQSANVQAVSDGATAAGRAERWRTDRLLSFPCATTGGIILADNFGGDSYSRGAGGHLGVDMWRVDHQPGQPLLACIEGVLVGRRALDGAQGNAWILQDANGDVYRYHHIQRFEPGLAVGDVVQRGDVIAYMGSTGNAAENAPHLHFEVRRGATTGPAVDPIPRFGLPLPNVTLV